MRVPPATTASACSSPALSTPPPAPPPPPRARSARPARNSPAALESASVFLAQRVLQTRARRRHVQARLHQLRARVHVGQQRVVELDDVADAGLVAPLGQSALPRRRLGQPARQAQLVARVVE